jgi:hypothetical protein
MTKQTKVRRARKWIRDMQKVLPTDRLVYLSAKQTKNWGDVGLTKRGYEIRLDWTQTWEVLEKWVLPHEYAHCRVWGRLQAISESHDVHLDVEVGIVNRAAEIVASYEE